MSYAQKAVLGKISLVERRKVADGVHEAGYMLCELFQSLEVLRDCEDHDPGDLALAVTVVTDLAYRMRKAALDVGTVASIEGGVGEDSRTYGRLEPGDVLDAASHLLAGESIAAEGAA